MKKKTKKSKGLTEKQRIFVEAYMGEAQGDAKKAATLAGYKHPKQMGSRLTKVDHVRKAIENRVQADPRVADRKERQEFWTSIMYAAKEAMPNRLKASELLGKSQADFIQRVQLESNLSDQELLKKAQKLINKSKTAKSEDGEDDKT